MVDYKCFDCGRTVEAEHVRRRVRCPYCSSKILLKQRPSVRKKIPAR
ncbi:DNA-directed RNA polymerase subunit P [archaeon CG10_big_fil_rev_8_21_14_0_10_43_11]|nr:MAG: DNA-directed RNA polymerase subunit P [archaeon CG10_big_fil_rev_8_21_14_0_10_43_11]